MTMQSFRELADEELDEIAGRIDAASPGPWLSYVAGRESEADSNYIELGACNELGSFASIELIGGTIADQDFIARARQDLPRLLLEVRILRARLAAMRVNSRSLEREPLGSLVERPGSLQTATA